MNLEDEKFTPFPMGIIDDILEKAGIRKYIVSHKEQKIPERSIIIFCSSNVFFDGKIEKIFRKAKTLENRNDFKILFFKYGRVFLLTNKIIKA